MAWIYPTQTQIATHDFLHERSQLRTEHTDWMKHFNELKHAGEAYGSKKVNPAFGILGKLDNYFLECEEEKTQKNLSPWKLHIHLQQKARIREGGTDAQKCAAMLKLYHKLLFNTPGNI